MEIPFSTLKHWIEDLMDIAVNGVMNKDSIQRSANIAKKYLPDIDFMRNEINSEKGYIEISNVPIDRTIPAPPSDGFPHPDKSHISELCLLGVTYALGLNPFSYQEEKRGALVHDIAPISGNKTSVSSNGVISFDFHTDGAYLERHIRPHTLSLLCLVDTSETGTRLASLQEALQLLRTEEIDALMCDDYYHLPPETFHVQVSKRRSSVLDKVDGMYEVKAALHHSHGITPLASNALNSLRSALQCVSIVKRWKPADIVIFSNLRCMHGRGEIKGERWLQRCYGSYVFPSGTVFQLNQS
ncbi:TauD/TfdA family dioxygenase [Xylella taiwanensis]|uniref:TauD/TfdA family dioxygenase n=1 Tax=Xylella taiwanensis TaxID=1444770 RepID=UPI001E2D045E|nr:TauD/TfdA family dioxygenase [Xylella taiwanensis]MCD8456963.1 TauD/TfdA family dioxygenase [Xylella taiwanensis]MCD8461755.1 TauD/TfdA family dioxygenase [Xylella taiwanensis]MCD8465999.1 TauD/TfdA family dioxygenase [Xylella taiwanensis]MCD8468678.1 TauD/TfdA family dioxygenase [Xylella taiwanensis]